MLGFAAGVWERDHKRWLGNCKRWPGASCSMGWKSLPTAQAHGVAMIHETRHTEKGCRWGEGVNMGWEEGANTGQGLALGTAALVGSCPVPSGSSTTSSRRRKGLYLQTPVEPSSCSRSTQLRHQVLPRSFYSTKLGKEHPPVGTGRAVGDPRLLLDAHWTQEGLQRGRDLDWRGPGRSWSTAAAAWTLHPPHFALAGCCP